MLSGAIDQMTQIPHKLVHVSVAISVEILLDHFQVGSVLEGRRVIKKNQTNKPHFTMTHSDNNPANSVAFNSKRIFSRMFFAFLVRPPLFISYTMILSVSGFLL